MRPWIASPLAASAVIATSLLAPLPAGGAETEVVPARVVAAPWSVWPLPNRDAPIEGRAITITIETGYCVGRPKPWIDHVRIVERPNATVQPFRSAVITAFVHFPEYERPVRPPSSDGVVYDVCAGLGLGLRKRIKLKRRPDRLALFDGSFSPPRKVRIRVNR